MKSPAPPSLLEEFLWIGRQQILACVFGILLLAALILTRSWEGMAGLSRQDFLFLYALGLQLLLIVLRFEHRDEVFVILVFHILATAMEWFKTSPSVGSWKYPAEGVIFRVYEVPLFAGFLYSAVGSYLARAWRLFRFRFTAYPPLGTTVVLAFLAYANFFTHHYVPDFRWPLIGMSVALFGRTLLTVRTRGRDRTLPLLPVFLGIAFLVWVAENAGTYARVWVYPHQAEIWHPVSIQKLWAWYLLMLLSFVLVSLVHVRPPKGAHHHVTKGPSRVIRGR